jgi:hypothetical protein
MERAEHGLQVLGQHQPQRHPALRSVAETQGDTMLKKFMITAAVGASVFGVAAASASTLNVAGENRNSPFARGVAQQSSQISATCTQLAVEPVLQVASGYPGAEVTGVTIRQQSVPTSCNGTQMQAVLLAGGKTVYSDIVTLNKPASNASDFTLSLPAGVRAVDVQTTTITIADEIKGPKNEVK